jgi:hypothetical protein
MAHGPVFMDGGLFYGHPFTGFRHLGYLAQLNATIEPVLEPVMDSEEKQHLLNMNGLDESIDMYILYIWTDVSVITKEKQGLSDDIYRNMPRHLLDYELCSITLHYNPNVIVSLVSALRVC